MGKKSYIFITDHVLHCLEFTDLGVHLDKIKKNHIFSFNFDSFVERIFCFRFDHLVQKLGTHGTKIFFPQIVLMTANTKKKQCKIYELDDYGKLQVSSKKNFHDWHSQ